MYSGKDFENQLKEVKPDYITNDGLTDAEREFLKAQIEEAKKIKKPPVASA